VQPGRRLLNAVQKPRRREDAGERGTERRIVLHAIFPVGLIRRENEFAFVGGERPAPGSGSEGKQCLQMPRLRGDLGRAKGLLLLFHLLVEQLHVKEHNSRAIVRPAIVLCDFFEHARRGERLHADELQFAPQLLEFRSASAIEQKPT